MQTGKRNKQLRARLDELYEEYNRQEYIEPDPLQFLYEYDGKKDARNREIAGIIASSLAFGSVGQIVKSLEKVLVALTDNRKVELRMAVMMDRGELKRRLRGIKHRWIDGDNIAALIAGVAQAIRRYGSLERCFAEYFKPESGSIRDAIDGFVSELRVLSGNTCGRLLPATGTKSACKRINLFLRWMVRKDSVDPGGWVVLSPEDLIYPVDVHIGRLGLELGFSYRKTVNFNTAEEITSGFREISPHDPVKYDFALTRFGIRDELSFNKLLKRLLN